MAHVHFDKAEDETHAVLVHDCALDECPGEQPADRPVGGRAGAGARPGRQDAKPFS